MRNIAKKGPIAKALCNYLLYVENNPKKVKKNIIIYKYY